MERWISQINASAVTHRFGSKYLGEDMDLRDCMDIIKERIVDVNNGDLQYLEGILLSQAMALNTIFTRTALPAEANVDNLKVYEKDLKLAMKAQNQCRNTLATLAEIKNPKPYIQNNKQHNQQINNNVQSPLAHAEESNNEPNEILEASTNEQE